MRFLTRMGPDVRSQTAGRERIAARLADVEFLHRMRAHVRRQDAGPASLADMRLLP